MKKYYILIFAAIILIGCGGEKKKVVFYDSDYDLEEDTFSISTDSEPVFVDVSEDNTVTIPFEERDGVKYVDVKVNGFGFQMIFDTGCSGTLISVAEARYLYEKGYLTVDDFLGTSQSLIADGSIVENMVVNLKEVIIADRIQCRDVTATVSANSNAPLLLGNEVLNRAASYSVDNQNKQIVFTLY